MPILENLDKRDNIIFQHDFALPHNSKSTKTGWREMELFVFRGEQTRLILMCIEYYEMCYQALRTVSKVKRRVKKDYTPGLERISSGRRLVATMPKQCAEVMKNKGFQLNTDT